MDAYLEDGTVPPPGTVCRQEVPFEAPQAQVAGRRRRTEVPVPLFRPHMKPLVTTQRR